jgi:hypothetical protein
LFHLGAGRYRWRSRAFLRRCDAAGTSTRGARARCTAVGAAAGSVPERALVRCRTTGAIVPDCFRLHAISGGSDCLTCPASLTCRRRSRSSRTHGDQIVVCDLPFPWINARGREGDAAGREMRGTARRARGQDLGSKEVPLCVSVRRIPQMACLQAFRHSGAPRRLDYLRLCAIEKYDPPNSREIETPRLKGRAAVADRPTGTSTLIGKRTGLKHR